MSVVVHELIDNIITDLRAVVEPANGLVCRPTDISELERRDVPRIKVEDGGAIPSEESSRGVLGREHSIIVTLYYPIVPTRPDVNEDNHSVPHGYDWADNLISFLTTRNFINGTFKPEFESYIPVDYGMDEIAHVITITIEYEQSAFREFTQYRSGFSEGIDIDIADSARFPQPPVEIETISVDGDVIYDRNE